jgi:hypothetical protein
MSRDVADLPIVLVTLIIVCSLRLLASFPVPPRTALKPSQYRRATVAEDAR